MTNPIITKRLEAWKKSGLYCCAGCMNCVDNERDGIAFLTESMTEAYEAGKEAGSFYGSSGGTGIDPIKEAQRETAREIVEMIDGMQFVQPEQAGQFSMHADGYNQAIEELKEELTSKYLRPQGGNQEQTT
jgi:hypothetical protein